MKRKRLYLVWSDKGGERYWSAEERIRVVDPITGAIKLQRRWHSLGVKGKDRRRTAEKVLRDMELEMVQKAAPAAHSLAVGQYLVEYLSAVRLSVKPSSLRSYASWLGLFRARFGLFQLTDIDHRVIEAWKIELGSRYSATSVNIGLRTLRAAFGYAVKHGILARSPMQGVKMAKVQLRTFAPYITMKTFMDIVLPAVTEPRHRVAFCFGMFAGLRRQEAVRLRWEQVDFARGEIRIESDETLQTKSGRGRVVPLYDTLRKELEALPRAGLFVLGSKAEVPDASALSHAWLRTVRALRDAGAEVPPISYHGLRHSYATWLASEGLNLKALQALLGHADIQTTMLYAHVQPQLAVEQAKKIQP